MFFYAANDSNMRVSSGDEEKRRQNANRSENRLRVNILKCDESIFKMFEKFSK